jgi:hypothetical protein
MTEAYHANSTGGARCSDEGAAAALGITTRKPGGTERVATHDDWQSANCELQVIMQVVVVEVSGVESPVKGVVTFGVVEVCANAASRTPKRIAAAAISIARARMKPPALDLP